MNSTMALTFRSSSPSRARCGVELNSSPLSEIKKKSAKFALPCWPPHPSLPNAAGHSLKARCSLTTSDMIYISMAHFTLMDAKGHFKLSFAEKFLYLGCDKTLQHIKYHTVALWQATKMSIKGSCKGTFGGVNTISHFGSVWNTSTSIFPILLKTGMEVLNKKNTHL